MSFCANIMCAKTSANLVPYCCGEGKGRKRELVRTHDSFFDPFIALKFLIGVHMASLDSSNIMHYIIIVIN